MRLTDNPSYRPREPWRPADTSRWAWPLFWATLLLLLVVMLALGHYVEAGVFAALCLIAVFVRRDQRR